MNRLIGLAGLAGCGKSTAAKWLVGHYGFERYRMAGPLKAMAREFCLTAQQIDGDQKETPIPWLNGVTPRYIMQTLGTEFGRDLIHPDVWVRIAERKIRPYLESPKDDWLFPGKDIVIDDIRFENEVDMVRRLGGKVYRIVGRPPSLFTVAQHISEAQAFPVDGTIENNGSIEDLWRSVDRIVASE